MRSMTGIGIGEAPLGSSRVVVEARSVNHRFLDVRVSVPDALSSHASFLEHSARAKLSRGRCEIVARVTGDAGGAMELDKERARLAYRALAELRDELAPGSELSTGVLAQIPGVFRPSHELPSEQVRAALTAALDAALGALATMRGVEGAALARELGDRLRDARAATEAIADLADRVVEAARQRFRTRIERLLAGAGTAVDGGRIETEVALVADRSDIREEIARLSSHFDQLEASISSDEQPVGRKLDFLLQEVARESNTIGSKCQDAELAQRVIALKTSIERLREQVQNVE